MAVLRTTISLLAAVILGSFTVSEAAVELPDLLKTLNSKLSLTTSSVLYHKQSKLAIWKDSSHKKYTLLAPTDVAWYSFFLDYQRGSVFIPVPPGKVQATFNSDLSIYAPKDFPTITQGLMLVDPGFSAFMVALLNHLTLPGNFSDHQQFRQWSKDTAVETATRFPLYVVKTHPPTFQPVPSDFDPALFSRQRELDPLYIPRMVLRKSSILEFNIHNDKTLTVHLVDDIAPYIDTSLIDPPSPPPPNGALQSHGPLWSARILTPLAAAALGICMALA